MTSRLSVIHELLRTTSVDELRAGRAALHTLAERVLAPDLYARTGYIGLRPTVDGFGQPELLGGTERRRARLVKNHLVVQRDVHETLHELTTLGEAAEAVGIELGAPLPYEASSPTDPDTPVTLRREVANGLAVSLNFAASTLEQVRRNFWPAQPSIYQLWPEHFDLAVQVGDVMIGASPGDRLDETDGRPTPYLYVAPSVVPDENGYWNEPYGAAIGLGEIRSMEHAVAFFSAGLNELDVPTTGR